MFASYLKAVRIVRAQLARHLDREARAAVHQEQFCRLLAAVTLERLRRREQTERVEGLRALLTTLRAHAHYPPDVTATVAGLLAEEETTPRTPAA